MAVPPFLTPFAVQWMSEHTVPPPGFECLHEVVWSLSSGEATYWSNRARDIKWMELAFFSVVDRTPADDLQLAVICWLKCDTYDRRSFANHVPSKSAARGLLTETALSHWPALENRTWQVVSGSTLFSDS